MRTGTAEITLQLAGDYIMPNSVVTATASSADPFGLVFSGELLSVSRGQRDADGTAHSVEHDGRQQIEVELGSWIKAMPLDPDPARNERRGYAANYAGRFYPFVSSLLRGTVRVPRQDDARLATVIVRFPDPYRPGWGERNVLSDGGERADCVDTPSAGGWTNYFRWATPVYAAEIILPLRLAGPTLSRTFGFPFGYWMLSLAAIALASLVAEPDAVAAAIIAIIGFFIQQWSRTERPHRLSLASALYTLISLLAVVWGVAWILFGWWAAWLLLPYGAAALWAAIATYRFTRTGQLPRSVAFGWQRALVRLRRFAQSSGLREPDIEAKHQRYLGDTAESAVAVDDAECSRDSAPGS